MQVFTEPFSTSTNVTTSMTRLGSLPTDPEKHPEPDLSTEFPCQEMAWDESAKLKLISWRLLIVVLVESIFQICVDLPLEAIHCGGVDC